MKIVITGATSMIGAALLNIAIDQGDEIYAIIRENTKRIDRLPKTSMIHVIKCEIEEYNDIQSIPADCDVLYHFAWMGTGKADRDKPDMQAKNIKYTLDAVGLAKRCGCKCFVGAGSQAEYGQVNDVIDKNTIYNPSTSYGIAKYASYILSKKKCEKDDISFRWGRIFSVYGPNDNEETMLNVSIDRFINGESPVLSLGKHMWNYLYETDAGEMFYRLGKYSLPDNAYLIAGKESKPLRKYIDEMIEVYGDGAKVVFTKDTGTQLPGLNVDLKETLGALKYEPVVGFKEGISKVINKRKFLAEKRTKMDAG